MVIRCFILVGLLSSWPLQSVESLSGEEIARRSDISDGGYQDSRTLATMILRDAGGLEARREMAVKSLERENDEVGDKSLILFQSPGEIEGTALLSHAKILEQDDQWLYLPAIKRVKRISSRNKSGPFVGSEFAFEDFTAQELSKFTYRYLRSEEHDGQLCDVIEREPRYEYSGYTKQLVWIDQEVFQFRKILFYGRAEQLVKTLTFEDYRLIQEKFWRPHRLSMVNHLTGKSTELIFSSYSFQNGFKDTDFSSGALQRLR